MSAITALPYQAIVVFFVLEDGFFYSDFFFLEISIISHEKIKK